MCNYRFIALIGLSIRSQNQSPPEQYVGDSVSLGQRVVSYPIHFVTELLEIFSIMVDRKKIKIKLNNLRQRIKS